MYENPCLLVLDLPVLGPDRRGPPSTRQPGRMVLLVFYLGRGLANRGLFFLVANW